MKKLTIVAALAAAGVAALVAVQMAGATGRQANPLRRRRHASSRTASST